MSYNYNKLLFLIILKLYIMVHYYLYHQTLYSCLYKF
jgi:hypothetical protein